MESAIKLVYSNTSYFTLHLFDAVPMTNFSAPFSAYPMPHINFVDTLR